MLKNILDYRIIRRNKKIIYEEKELNREKLKDNVEGRKIRSRKRERIRVRKK